MPAMDGRELALRIKQDPLVARTRLILATSIPRRGDAVSMLEAGFDATHERTTDAEGRCSYTPREGNLVLVVTHLVKPDEAGEGYDKTAYAATLVIDVPQRCPCCAVD